MLYIEKVIQPQKKKLCLIANLVIVFTRFLADFNALCNLYNTPNAVLLMYFIISVEICYA